MVTSSAVVASSAISSAGSQEIAIAIRTRCSIPPESSAGYWSYTCSGSCRPTAVNSSIARCARRPALHAALDAQHLGELLSDGQRRVQVRGRVLEDGADRVRARPPSRAVASRQGTPSKVSGPARRRTRRERAEHRPARERLAAAGLADEPDGLPADPERDVAHGGASAVLDGDREVLDDEHVYLRRGRALAALSR